MKKYIVRPSYIKKVEPFIDKALIKVMTGQRRIGKSYMLLQIADMLRQRHLNANFIYIDKEQLDFAALKTEQDLYQYVQQHLKQSSPNYLFIDEVQEIDNFQLALRSLLNENACDIYCTGSNARILSGELATHLAGRYIEIHVHSLSYQEFLDFNQLEADGESLRKYLIFGGMPYLHNLPMDENIIFEYLRSVYSTILLKDVVSRENIRNVSFLENLVAYLADNTGSLFSAQNISKYLKSQHVNIPTQTILNYLRALCNSFFIYKLQRADTQGMKIFEIGEKYYFENLGIRNIVIGYRITDRAKLLENLVYNHLLYLGYEVRIGYIGDKEIDFIGEKSNEKIYVQVALQINNETTAQREFGNLLKIPDNYLKIVVTDEAFQGNTYEGIRHYSIQDFLSGFNG